MMSRQERPPISLLALGIVVLAVGTGCGPSLQRRQHIEAAAAPSVVVRGFRVAEGLQPQDAPLASQDHDRISTELVAALNQAGFQAAKATLGGAEPDIVIEGEITNATRGKRWLRYLGGGGAARFGVSGRSLRPDGTVLGEFSATRYADFGLFGGNSDTLFSYCIEAVAIDVANMVVTGTYQHLSEGVVVGAGALVHP